MYWTLSSRLWRMQRNKSLPPERSWLLHSVTVNSDTSRVSHSDWSWSPDIRESMDLDWSPISRLIRQLRIAAEPWTELKMVTPSILVWKWLELCFSFAKGQTQKCFSFKWHIHLPFGQHFVQCAGVPTPSQTPVASLLEDLSDSHSATELWTLTLFV